MADGVAGGGVLSAVEFPADAVVDLADAVVDGGLGANLELAGALLISPTCFHLKPGWTPRGAR